MGTARLIRDGEVTAAEVLEATLARIEAERALNAVVIDLFDRAQQQNAVGVSGPFAGVPLLLKDACQELAGTPHWVGTAVLHQEKHLSAVTTPLASLFEQLGFVIVGKGNVPELSVSSSTESAEFGATHNPYQWGTTAGGSSGGYAAAVAARLTPVAHGSDGSGSLRIPASACGLLTLKPSRGRGPASLPAAGDVDLSGLWAEFALVRTARDLAALWSALAIGPTAIPLELPRLRVGLLRSDPLLGSDVDAACVQAVEEAGRALAELGHEVEEKHPPALEGFVAAVSTRGGRSRARAGQAAWIEQRIGRPLRQGDVSPEMMAQIEMARAESTATVDAEAQRQVATRLDQLQRWWEHYDLLVTPTLRMPPWPHGEPAAANTGAFCLPFSLTGQPVVGAPVHTHDGIPVGVQIVGRYGRDEDLLAVVRDLEAVLGWDGRPWGVDRTRPDSSPAL